MSEPASLGHVVVAAGTPEQWLAMSPPRWAERLRQLVTGVASSGSVEITLLPHHGQLLSDIQLGLFEQLFEAASVDLGGKFDLETHAGGPRWVWRRDDGTLLVVDPCPDGHLRFARVVESLRTSGHVGNKITEHLLSTEMLAPCVSDVDLLVIVGPADRIPASVVWEMAYSEFVYLDLSWDMLSEQHLELAVDDFNRRHRRFGGLDS